MRLRFQAPTGLAGSSNCDERPKLMKMPRQPSLQREVQQSPLARLLVHPHIVEKGAQKQHGSARVQGHDGVESGLKTLPRHDQKSISHRQAARYPEKKSIPAKHPRKPA